MATPIPNVSNTLQDQRKRELSPSSPSLNSKRSRLDTLFQSPSREIDLDEPYNSLLGAQSPLLEERSNLLPEPGRGYDHSPSRRRGSSALNHDLLGEAILEEDEINEEDDDDDDEGLFSTNQDKPFRRSLYSELVSSSNLDENDFQPRRRSIMSSNLFDVNEEDEDNDDQQLLHRPIQEEETEEDMIGDNVLLSHARLEEVDEDGIMLQPQEEEEEDEEEGETMEDKTTLPLSRSYVRPTHPPVYEDEVDAFFSSHNPADEPEYVLSSALKMNLLQQQHLQGPPFITNYPHFLTEDYFEHHGPQDRFIRRHNTKPSHHAIVPYFEEKFHIIKNMGSGEYAQVWRAVCLNDNQECAIKKSKLPFTGWDDRWLQIIEVDHLRRVSQSKHCVNLLSAWEERGFLYIQLELCSNGSLDQYIQFKNGKIEEEIVWKIFYEVVLGLQDIHAAQIVHLDLKPSNILIDDKGRMKISDFGISVQTPVDMRWVKGEGDRRYMAPDLLREDFDKPADIFSLGLILLELATGIVLPGTGESWEMLRVGDFSKQKTAMSKLSSKMGQMIEWLLTTESKDRPTVNEIIHHPTFVHIQAIQEQEQTSALNTYVQEMDQLRAERTKQEQHFFSAEEQVF